MTMTAERNTDQQHSDEFTTEDQVRDWITDVLHTPTFYSEHERATLTTAELLHDGMGVVAARAINAIPDGDSPIEPTAYKELVFRALTLVGVFGALANVQEAVAAGSPIEAGNLLAGAESYRYHNTPDPEFIGQRAEDVDDPTLVTEHHITPPS